MSKTTGKLITNRGAQYWECPFCKVANGTPEMTVCAECGAVLDGVSARKAEDAGTDLGGVGGDAVGAGVDPARDRRDPLPNPGKR